MVGLGSSWIWRLMGREESRPIPRFLALVSKWMVVPVMHREDNAASWQKEESGLGSLEFERPLRHLVREVNRSLGLVHKVGAGGE